MNIAVLVEGGLVETLQATPLLRTLALGVEEAHLTLVGPRAAAQLRGSLPGVDELIALRVLDADGGSPLALLTAWRELRRRRFEVAILCSGSARVRLLVYLAGIQRRIASFGGISTSLLSEYVATRRGENNAQTWLRLASAMEVDTELHDLAFDPGPKARDRAEAALLGGGLEDGRLLVAVAPGTGYAEGAAAVAGWDPERYAHLCNQLSNRHGAGVIILGAESDRAAADQLLLDLAAPAIDLTGELDLREIAAVLERCDLFVGGDSPLLQLAAGVGTAAVGLFGATDGRRRGPYGTAHRVVQAVDSRSATRRARELIGTAGPPLLGQIRVDDVLAGIEAAL
ncbi:MAG: hypothetical protein NVSMB29_17320 [Candidatus Dormibacteria bacterium]